MPSDLKNRSVSKSNARASSAEHVMDISSPRTSNESSCFKENININKCETPKLCMEPLSMKRKKKGGVYNLRKSLAWDKAFLTEEGVLDPVELSVISGGSPHLPKHVDLQKIEKNLPKEIQDEDRSKDSSSSKFDSSSSNFTTSTSVSSSKIPTHLGSKSASRFSDCPRPLPSSSLKRPAIGKATGKDLKLPKVPGPKTGVSPICATTSSTVLKSNCVKHNQITKPDFNIQRTPGLKSFSKSFQNTQSASKASSLRPPCYSDGNSGNSSIKRISSVNMSPILVDNADNSGSKMISDTMIPTRSGNSSEEGQQESTSFTAPFSRNVHVGGMTIHPSQNQPMKPSGLRMPSPSLSFFSQPKRSVFHDLPLRDKETDNCVSQKPEKSRFQDNLRRTVKIDNNLPVCTVSSSKVISSSSECVTSSHVSSFEVIKPKLEQNPMQKIPDIPKKNRTGKIIHEGRELQEIDIEVPSDSGYRGQVTEDKFLREANEGSQEEACNSYCHEPSKDSLCETDKRTDEDKNLLRTTERTSQHLDVSQQNGSCYSGSATIEALEISRSNAGNAYIVSKHLHADLLEETAFTDISADTLMGEVHMENAVFASSAGGCNYDNNLISEADDTDQSGNGMEPQRNGDSSTSDRLLSEQLCLQNSQQEKNVEEILFAVPHRKDGNEVMDTKTASSLSPGKTHDFYVDEDRMTGQLLVSAEFNFADDSRSPESHSSLSDVISNRGFKGSAHVLSGADDRNLIKILHKDTQRTNIDYCSSLPESRTREGSEENTLAKVTEAGSFMQDGSADNQLTSPMTLKESQSELDNLRNLRDLATVLVQSPEGNMLNDGCFIESECSTLPSSRFVDENVANLNDISHFENDLQTKHPVDFSYVDNVTGSTEVSVTGQNDLCISTSRSGSQSVKETHSKGENCTDAYGIGGYTAYGITDISRGKLFSDPRQSEVSEDTNSSVSYFHPKLDNVKVEAAFAPANKNGASLNEKSRTLILPQNAIPFSDEWLAAIEAAGEDILTKKSGAVQNSPPDKSIPEPSPWSPVKKKNNQIGPFDCTKFTNIVPSDS